MTLRYGKKKEGASNSNPFFSPLLHRHAIFRLGSSHGAKSRESFLPTLPTNSPLHAKCVLRTLTHSLAPNQFSSAGAKITKAERSTVEAQTGLGKQSSPRKRQYSMLYYTVSTKERKFLCGNGKIFVAKKQTRDFLAKGFERGRERRGTRVSLSLPS